MLMDLRHFENQLIYIRGGNHVKSLYFGMLTLGFDITLGPLESSNKSHFPSVGYSSKDLPK